MIVDPPIVSWDQAQHMHKITATFRWKGTQWGADAPFLRYGPIGGDDAFGLWFSRKVTPMGGKLTLSGLGVNRKAPSTWRTSAWKRYDRRIQMIAFQDKGVVSLNPFKGTTGAINSFSGVMEVWVKFPVPTCFDIQSAYSHTANNASITSIGLSAAGPAPMIEGKGSKWVRKSVYARKC